MNAVIVVTVLVAYFAILANLPSIMFFVENQSHRRAVRASARKEREKQEFHYRESVREARLYDKLHRKELKRLEQQMEIGDPIFRMLIGLWDQAGHLVWRKPQRNSNLNGTYYLRVCDKSGTVADVAVDNRLPKHMQVSVTVGGNFWTMPVRDAIERIGRIFTERQVFKA